MREGIREQTDRNHNHRKLTNLITWTTALSNSMKLWAMPCRATQDGQVMVESSDRMWSTGEREWQATAVFLPWESHEQYEKTKRYDTEKWTPQVGWCQICYWRSVENNSRKNEEMKPKQKQHPVADVTGDGSKVQCCKEQYCIGTWNVRSMNQGKLEVVKQEMARVNVDILGIS